MCVVIVQYQYHSVQCIVRLSSCGQWISVILCTVAEINQASYLHSVWSRDFFGENLSSVQGPLPIAAARVRALV
jgi:hypothetical protein